MALRMESKLGRLFRPLAKQARYMHAAKAAVGTRSGRRCTKCKEELSQCSILALRAGTSYSLQIRAMWTITTHGGHLPVPARR